MLTSAEEEQPPPLSFLNNNSLATDFWYSDFFWANIFVGNESVLGDKHFFLNATSDAQTPTNHNTLFYQDPVWTEVFWAWSSSVQAIFH